METVCWVVERDCDVGRGLLAEKMEQSLINFDMSIVDKAIKEHVTPFLYNQGAGMWIPKKYLHAPTFFNSFFSHLFLVFWWLKE